MFIENVEDLDIVMLIDNLFEYSDNYFVTPGSLWNYRDEVNDDANEIKEAGNYMINNNKTTTNKYFEYMTKISEISRTDAVAANPSNPAIEATQTNAATFQINSTRLYIPLVT